LRKRLLILLFITLLTLLGCNDKTDEYREELLNVADDILSNSAEVENILEQYSRIWNFTIKSNGAILVEDMMSEMNLDRNDIEKHFTINAAGNIPDDFSLNIFSLQDHLRDVGKIALIEETSRIIRDSVSELNNPPSGFDNAFNELLDLYDVSEEYLEMALNPTGSLQSFNENKNRLSSDILSKYKRIEVLVPSE